MERPCNHGFCRRPLHHSASMMTTTTPQATNQKLNFNNKDYEFSDLPRTAQLLPQDMMQMDQQISKLQFELRHLQAARQVGASERRHGRPPQPPQPRRLRAVGSGAQKPLIKPGPGPVFLWSVAGNGKRRGVACKSVYGANAAAESGTNGADHCSAVGRDRGRADATCCTADANLTLCCSRRRVKATDLPVA